MRIENGILYDVTDEDIVNGTFVIPEEVKVIGDYAFYRCIKLTSIMIPDGVTRIGYEAFHGCERLTSVTIPNSVTRIEEDAFRCCSKLTSVVIPDSVTSISRYTFHGCSGLTSVIIPNSVTSIGVAAFQGCRRLTSITIPNNVVSIGDAAFALCAGLTSITVESGNTVYHSNGNCLIETSTKTLIVGCKNSVIPTDGSVTIIGKYPFCNYSELTSIVIPNSVTSIGDYAFVGCNDLINIIVTSNLTNIGKDAFKDCPIVSKKANYKAFNIKNGELYCRDKQYKENTDYFVEGELEMCENGIHYCTNLFEVFNYYNGEIDKDIAIYEIEVGDDVLMSETSKCCTNRCKLKKRLYREDIIRILNGGEI